VKKSQQVSAKTSETKLLRERLRKSEEHARAGWAAFENAKRVCTKKERELTKLSGALEELQRKYVVISASNSGSLRLELDKMIGTLRQAMGTHADAMQFMLAAAEAMQFAAKAAYDTYCKDKAAPK
jgi:hypothetical protein